MKRNLLFQVLLCALIIALSSSKNGLDFNLPYTDSTFACFSQQTATFVVVQAYQSYGGLNNYAVQNLKTAKNRGFTTDIFMNSCTAKDPSVQVNQMLNAIPDYLYDTVWIRVESNYSPGCGWTNNTPEKNCLYLRSLVSGVQTRGKKVGIYSSTTFWKQAFQSFTYCSQVSNLPLWYAANDGSPSFSNFYSFGGWTTPTLKTFNFGVDMCGTTINADWRP